jgi:hypothetical protein
MAKRMGATDKRYALLLAGQTIGSIFLLSQCIPIYSRLLENPGSPQRLEPVMVTATVLSIMLIQCAYWYRVFNVALPVQNTRVVYGHLVLFTSRLGFIVASSLFSFVLFRHLPEFNFVGNWLSFLWRAGLLLALLFSLYCFTNELERLGTALRGHERQAR